MSFDLPGVEHGSDSEILFKAVGFVVVQWGIDEQHLDLIVAAIFHRFGGHPLLNRRPTNLSQKIELLRQCFAEFNELSQFQTECNALLARFASASRRRNDIVHGAIADLSVKDGAFIFSKIDVIPRDHHSIRSVFFDGSGWPTFRNELLSLGRESLSLAQRVWDIYR
jgi:DNA-directed RNA polymerase subunit F